MKFVMQHVAGARENYVEQALKVIPDLQIVECEGVPMETFRECCIHEAHWHLEDDIILAPDFLERCEKLVEEKGEHLIRGFCQQRGEGEFRPGSSFVWNQCVWMPEGYGTGIANMAADWKSDRWGPCGFDYVIRDFLKERKERYWIEFPSLVQHAEGNSLIGPRSRRRVSQSFIDTYGDLCL